MGPFPLLADSEHRSDSFSQPFPLITGKISDLSVSPSMLSLDPQNSKQNRIFGLQPHHGHPPQSSIIVVRPRDLGGGDNPCINPKALGPDLDRLFGKRI